MATRRRPSARNETSERTGSICQDQEQMNGGHGARAHDAAGRKRSIAHLVRADDPEPFSRTLRKRARGYATAPQHLATTEADPFSLLQKLANRRPRRVVDNRTLG